MDPGTRADNETETAEVDGCRSPDNDNEVSDSEASAVQSECSPFASLRIPESRSRIAIRSCENKFHYAESELDTGGDESTIALKGMVKIEVLGSGKGGGRGES